MSNLFLAFYSGICAILLLHAASPSGFVSRLLPLSPELFTGLAVIGAIMLFRIAQPPAKQLNFLRTRITPVIAACVIVARIIELLTHSNFIFTYTHLDPNALTLLSFFALATYIGTLGKKGLKENPPYAIFMFGVLLLHIPFMRWYDYGLYNALSGEDKAFEWLQFIVYQCGTVILAILAYQLAKLKNRTPLITLLIIYALFAALGYFLIAGEEVSWGQRIIGFDTPQEYIDYNSQGEFNLHNNEKIFNKIYYIYGLVGVYALVSSLLYNAFKKTFTGIKAVLVRMLTFRWYHGIYFIPTIIYVAYRVYYQTSAYDIWEESTEVLFATGMLAYAIHVWFVSQKAISPKE